MPVATLKRKIEISQMLPQFLDQVALDAGDRQADQDEDAVQLMTLTQRQRPGVSAGVYCRHGGKFIPPQNVFR